MNIGVLSLALSSAGLTLAMGITGASPAKAAAPGTEATLAALRVGGAGGVHLDAAEGRVAAERVDVAVAGERGKGGGRRGC